MKEDSHTKFSTRPGVDKVKPKEFSVSPNWVFELIKTWVLD